MKRLLLTASLAAAPMLSSAAPITDPYGAVDVEYWGRLDRCTDGSDCSYVPSVLHGRLEIDLSLAPRDISPSLEVGHYARGQFGFLAPGFVIASGQGLLGFSEDLVYVSEFGPFNPGTYYVRNYAEIRVDGELVAMQKLDVRVSSFSDWGIHGDSIVQQFDVRTAEIGGETEGVFEEIVDGVSRSYRFFIDRMRATPRVCRP